jgi:hypothetical protein
MEIFSRSLSPVAASNEKSVGNVDRKVHLEIFSRNLSPVAASNEKGVGNVDGKIHAEADRDDEAVAGDHVDGEAPKVHEPRHVDDGGRHAEEDDPSSGQAISKTNKIVKP